jgi:serine/threonine-protein kinase
MSDASEPKIADPRLGAVIDGRYRLDERLAAGGMGVVYKGERIGIGKAVAIKFLHETFAVLPDLVRRFEREAVAMSKLSHPNIVSVIDHGVAGGAPYLVMEFQFGRSLGDILTGGPLPPRRAVSITRQILSGMRHAHDLGVVHRDLKPDNIMLLSGVEADFVKILDFGLAKVVRGDGEDSTQLTNAGFALGTPGYMSPEQAQGSKLDHRSDIYSVGVMLFEMVVGHKPFRAESPIVLLRMQMDDAPPRPRSAAPLSGMSTELEKVILKSLEKPPSKRYQNAGEFANALENTAEGRVSEISMPIELSSSDVVSSRSDPALSPTIHHDSGPTKDDNRPPSVPEFERRAETRLDRPAPQPEKQVVVVERSGFLGKIMLVLLVAGGGAALAWAKLHPTSAAEVKEKLAEAGRVVVNSEKGKKAPGPLDKRAPVAAPSDKRAPVVVASDKRAPVEPVSETHVAVPSEPRLPAKMPDAAVEVKAPPESSPSIIMPKMPDGAVATLDDEDDDTDEAPPEVPPKDSPAARMEQQAAAEQQLKPQPQLGTTIKPPTAKEVVDMLNAGQVDEAIKTLYLVRKHEPKNPKVALLLGHAYFMKMWRTDGLREYWKALGTQKGYRWDKTLQRNAISALDNPTYRLSRTLIRKRVGTAALGELRVAARSAHNPNVKRRAGKLVTQMTGSHHSVRMPWRR